MAWRKLAFLDEVATLDGTPPAVDGSAGAAGTATTASRSDHRHALGPMVADIDWAGYQALNLVVHRATDYPTPVEAKIFYYLDPGDSHLYVYLP